MKYHPTVIISPSSDETEYLVETSYVSKIYGESIRKASGIPVMPVTPKEEFEFERIYETMDALLLPGGEDVNPLIYNEEKKPYTDDIDYDRDAIDFKLIDIARKKGVPILGICRGMQIINIYFGGTLFQDVKKEYSSIVEHDNHDTHERDFPAHAVRLAHTSKLYSILRIDYSKVNGLHHQGIHEIGKGLVATAWADDGLIEAIEKPDEPFIIGVQWHPEELVDHMWEYIFNTFVETAHKKFVASSHVISPLSFSKNLPS